MINRELTEREKEMLGMIIPTTFQDIVDVVRKDVEQSRYDAKRELRSLYNGVARETNGITNEATNEVTKDITNEEDRINNIREKICEAI
jgi:hypothetical protein